MAQELSKTKIDQLGDRLKKGCISDDDLRLLDQYRLSFSHAYEFVVGEIQIELKLEPTGRPAKSTTSISDKLFRESIRLTQIQDIAGCRLIFEDAIRQGDAVKSLEQLFDDTRIVDRREKPSHGYRAVHVIVNCLGKQIEIQIRTTLQHLWAEFSEKLSDILDPTIKYGGGPNEIQAILQASSSIVSDFELTDVLLTEVASKFSSQEDKQKALNKLKNNLEELRQTIFDSFGKITDNVIEKFAKLKS